MSTPFIVHWPARIQTRGELRHQGGHLIHLMPTCLEVAGAEYPHGQKFQPLEGASLVPAFANRPIQRGPLFWEHESHRAVRDGKWKLVANKGQPWELYDLEADRVELNKPCQGFFRRRRKLRRAAFDSTGLQCGHASAYYTRRRAQNGEKTVFYKPFAKLEAASDCATHFVIAATTLRGPCVDNKRFVPLLDQALNRILLDSVLADAGFDSEANHRHAREQCGVRSFIPATIGRPTSKPLKGRYRRRMKQRLNKNYGGYGQRWQAETVFSMIKRRLSACVAARYYWSSAVKLCSLLSPTTS